MVGKKDFPEKFKLRRRVMKEVAKLTINNELAEKIDQLPEKLLETQGNIKYRCCEYKEKAIYSERIKSVLGLTPKKEYRKKRLSELIEIALQEPDKYDNQINVMDIACEGCPINRFFITNACQNCLAHSCQYGCPKGAISIVQNQAYIDQNRCVECGICKRSCPYGAIVEINRPCEASCAVGAINATIDRKAQIDNEKCVECGSCMESCPFVAITDRSQIVKVIKLLREEQNVIAILAPAFIGQLGHKDNPGPVLEALEKLGFAKVYEAALGADIVSLEELEEFIAKVPRKQKFMTTSCCPSFVSLVKKHFPDLSSNISSTVSPMVALAEYLKEQNAEQKIVFLGPCIAKKSEARDSGVIDAVLTFEELAALLEAAEIDVSQLTGEGKKLNQDVSQAGRFFAKSGGVAQSIEKLLTGEDNLDWHPDWAQGLGECSNKLKTLRLGKTEINFFEGMACLGGCLGGPGKIIDARKSNRFLEQVSQSSEKRDAAANELAVKIKEEIKFALHRS